MSCQAADAPASADPLVVLTDALREAIVAAFGAALLADKLDPTVLRRIFAAVFIYFALTMIVGAVRGERVSEREGR